MNSTLFSSYKSVYKTTLATISFGFFKLLKISKIAGFKYNFFSMSSLAAPVIATHVSITSLIAITLLRTVIHSAFYPLAGFLGLFYHLPSFAGALYFKKMLQKDMSAFERMATLIAPLICMALFMSTSVGAAAWVYSLYWLIPAVLACLPQKNVFLSALASTFMVHAVGSVLFIYTTPMTPIFWMSILPVVLLERCSFALGITALYYLVHAAQHGLKAYSLRLARA